MQYYLLAIVIVTAVGLMVYLQATAKPSPYDDRECAGRAWKRAFPKAESSDIRRFLDCLVEGMDLPQPRLAFRPDDRVIDIYRSPYGGRTPLADDCECEQFLAMIEVEFGVEANLVVDNVWHDDQVTLGQIYRYVSRPDPYMLRISQN